MWAIAQALAVLPSICLKCQRFHHSARKCPFTASVSQVMEGTEKDGVLQKVLMIEVKKIGKKLLAEMQCSGQREYWFKWVSQSDSAASCNVLSYRDYQSLGRPRWEKSSTTLTMYDDGLVRKSMGSCLLTVKDKDGVLKQLYF